MTTPVMTTVLAMPASGLVMVVVNDRKMIQGWTRCAGTTGQTSG